MLCDQVAAISDNLVGILHDLQLLVAIVPMQPHAFADDFEDIDDPERPISLMRAQLAMIAAPLPAEAGLAGGLRRLLRRPSPEDVPLDASSPYYWAAFQLFTGEP